MGAVANQWIMDVLRSLREVLTTWPAVLPSRIGDPIKPLRIGTYEDLAALLGPPPSDAHEVLRRALRRYTLSNEYRSALNAEGSWRHGRLCCTDMLSI
jgi:sRNA-binding protein